MTKDKNYEDEIDLKQYQSDNNVSLQNMNIGLWLSEKRALFVRLLILVLILLSVWFFVYSAYQYFTYYIETPENTPENNNLLSPRNLISDLKINSPRFFKSGDKYDLVVEISNDNDKFSANFEACFNLDDRAPICEQSFILPSESKYIFILGQDIKNDVKNLTYSNQNVSCRELTLILFRTGQNF